jgi:protein-S-isoprenylcysteine O-methyltransferase Ste14
MKRRAEILFAGLRAAVYVSGFVALFAWLAWSLRINDKRWSFRWPAETEIPGMILVIIGGLLVLASAVVFVIRGRGTPAAFDAPKRFVVLGPYKYMRNPIYVGGTLVLVGFALFDHSISILLFSLVFFLLFHLFVVFFEEPELKRKFGAEYEDYCKTIPRWIPSVTRRKQRQGPHTSTIR